MTTPQSRRLELSAFMGRMEGMVVERDGCWIWKGAGITPVMSWEKKTVMVRRKLYELKHGEIPAGACISYGCDNSACVHPSHIKAFTRSELRKRDADARNYLDPAFRTKQQKAKLRIPDEKVEAILKSDAPIKPLAKSLGVSQHAVWSIRNGRVRRDLMSAAGVLGARIRKRKGAPAASGFGPLSNGD